MTFFFPSAAPPIRYSPNLLWWAYVAYTCWQHMSLRNYHDMCCQWRKDRADNRIVWKCFNVSLVFPFAVSHFGGKQRERKTPQGKNYLSPNCNSLYWKLADA